MLRGWLSSKGTGLSSSSQSLNTLDEPQNLESALRAATCIMNDDLEAAESGLEEGNSSFHKLGKGMVTFLRATLGFEPEIMRQGRLKVPILQSIADDEKAADRLADAASSAAADHKRAQRDTHAFRSSIYPAGSEYALCHAETQIMGAVVGILNENLMEGIKGFYKLRKAYLTLNTILEAEKEYVKNQQGTGGLPAAKRSVTSLSSERSARIASSLPGGFGGDGADKRQADRESALDESVGSLVKVDHPDEGPVADEDGDEFEDAEEQHEDAIIPHTYLGSMEIESAATAMADTSLEEKDPAKPDEPVTTTVPRVSTAKTEELLSSDPNSPVLSNPIDAFVHSGTSMSFGLLLLIISMIPPAFGRLLQIIGFHGDRTRGVKMLWQASKFHNIFGAMAGLIILGYYNGLVGFCDVLPENFDQHAQKSADPTAEGYPVERLEALLADMRSRFPKSHLWLLEEARMQSSKKKPDVAIKLLSSDTKSPLKQVEALSLFEKSLNAMYSHQYQLCADSFVHSCSLNNWSHALYYYIAGACHVELYRLANRSKDIKKAKHHAKEATDLLLNKVREHAGKKKFMARQLPFDQFVIRKLAKWDTRTKERNIPFIDAVGVSPVEEMIYFWNGHKRMDDENLHISIDRLAWSEDASLNPMWKDEGVDETAILAMLRAAVWRNMGRHEDACDELQKGVLCHDKALFKNKGKDDWVCATAHYEMGAGLWFGRKEKWSKDDIAASTEATEVAVGTEKAGEADAKKREMARVIEAESWIDKAAKWERYELDARIGLKVTTALETIRGWKDAQ
ncbi:Mitochondrial outer membrane protein iml2 [Agyrium rufum]|nr:Mitochondrial outer membrane protein iml2 [Agyrium rufum]